MMKTDIHLSAGHTLDAINQSVYMLDGLLTDIGIQRANGALENDLLGDDVCILTTVDLAERDDDRILAVRCSGHKLVESADKLGGSGDGIDRFMRPGCVTASTTDGDSHVIATCR